MTRANHLYADEHHFHGPKPGHPDTVRASNTGSGQAVTAGLGSFADVRIAIIGTRGVPPNYGGFETFAAELSTRLTARGMHVTVYCRSSSYPGDERFTSWRGVQRVIVPAPRSKHLETVVSTLLAMLHVTFRRRADVVVLVNGVNAFSAWLPRIVGIPVYLNVDGIERQRVKWGTPAKLVYLVSEFLAKRTATGIIADAEVVADYYQERHGVSSTVIGYGAPVRRDPDHSLLASLGVNADEYVLYVSRLEPENNANQVIEAFGQVKTGLPLLIVGDAPYAHEYKRRAHALAALDDRVVMLGAVYGEGYRALQEGATVYVQATSVGGTHPALVEAMGAGNAVLANSTPEHREVLADAGMYYRGTAELAEKLQILLDDPALRTRLGQAAQHEVRTRYSWDAVTDKYELLLKGSAAGVGMFS